MKNIPLSLFQNPVGFDRLMRFLRIKPYEAAFFKGCRFKTEVLKRSLLTIFVFVFCLFVCGCDAKKSPEAALAAGQPAGAPLTGGSAKYSDDGKRIITIGTWYDKYYVSRHTDIHDDPKLSQFESAQMKLDKMREVEKKYNIILNYVNLTFDGVQESIRASIPSGRPDVDIYETDLQFGIPAALNGFGVSLREMGLAGTDVFGPNKVMHSLSLPGQDDIYLFAPSNSGGTPAYVLAFNMNMIKGEGLPNPQDLYDRGEWTWQKWREYLKVLTKDIDGDGTADIYGYSGWWTLLLTNLLFSNGAGIAPGPREGLSSKATEEVLDFIKTLYVDDKTARPWDQNWNINNSLYADGLAAFWIGSDWIFNEYGGSNLPFEIGVVPWPAGPSGSFEKNKHSQPPGNWYFIPKGTENPRLVYDVMFDWFNWYNGDTDIGVDTSWSRSMYMNERNFEYASIMSSRHGLDMWDFLSTKFNLIPLMNGEFNTAQIVNTYSQAFQDALDNIYK
ncbi:MAG: extracellular solute-binding protein [Treponema sp.]|jgi:hypothetical protein|nr:extracellular solute-binding protein [Treponema sp.]